MFRITNLSTCSYSAKILLSLLLFVLSYIVHAAPFLSEPKFIQVSTEQGLTQDTVNSLLIDHDGFLWIATDGGLNRYDGYQVEPITGPNRELEDQAISALFQAKNGDLWISTLESGLYKLNLADNSLMLMGDWRFREQPDWFQDAVHLLEPKADEIYVALNEQVVLLSAGQSQVLFELEPELSKQENAIRRIWTDNDVLLVGTTVGIFGVDLATGTSKKIEHLGNTLSTVDNLNVKFFHHQNDTLWVGTVEGLYSLPLQHTLDYVKSDTKAPLGKQRVTDLNIWKMLPANDTQFYLATDNGMYSYAPESDQLQHLFLTTDSRYYLTDNNIIDLIVGKNGNLWLATFYDGALLWSPRSTQFTSILQDSEDESTLSNNMVMALHQQNNSELWIGTNNGINLYDLESGDIQSYLINPDKKAPYSPSSIYQIFPADEDSLWYVNSEGLAKFDTNQRVALPVVTASEEDKQLISGYIWGAQQDNEGNIWLLRDEGVFKYDATSGQVTLSEIINETLDLDLLQQLLPDVKGQENSFLLPSKEALYRYNYAEGTLTQIHQLPDRGVQHKVPAGSALIDRNGIMWVAYPGFGLFGLDAETYEQKYFFDRTNLLPNNSIYGLQMDDEGNIWMGSHQGLLKFYPDNQHLQKFTYADGVVSLEFNQGAKLLLDDGKMVYGSQKGVTIFNPSSLKVDDQGPFNVNITGIDLSSSSLDMPLTSLNGSFIEMKYDDVGLSINFSTLTYDYQSNTRYFYELIGASEVKYPMTRDHQVTFATLKPGDYQFKVTALDPINGRHSRPATVKIRVHHAPWASPEAYSFYMLVALALFLIWRNRKNNRERQIRLAHREALQSKNRLSLALTASNSNVWEWNAIQNNFYAPRIADELDHKEMGSEITFEQHLNLIHRADRQLYESSWQQFIDNQEPGFDVTYRMKTANGEWYWYRDVGSVVSEAHEPDKVIVSGTYSNITESLANREKVRLFGEAFKHTRDWVAIFNAQHQPVAVNTAFSEAFGIDEQGDLASQVSEIFKLEDEHSPRFWQKLKELGTQEHWKGEETLSNRQGKARNVLINMTSVASMQMQNEVDYYLIIMSDISEQKEAEHELRRLANFDSLTDLPNRTLLLDRIKHAIDHASRHKSNLGVFFIDLDRFKQVNDSLGHNAGDELLKVVAQRLTNLLRQDDTVARLGGDEFVVMVEDVKQPDKLSALASEVISVLEAPIQLGNQTVSVSSSVGIALYPGDAENSEELLRNADLAMYHAKELGRSNFQYFTEHMNQQAQARLALENQLKHAYQNKGFINYYQPIVNLQQGIVEGFELLMRWPADDGMIPPDIFIPVAEELGLIEGMTMDALEAALPVLAKWYQTNKQVYLSVNLSARHFERRVSIEQIISLLQNYELPVSCLRFEITESALMRDYERALEYMEAMCDKGFVIALDDFGTGYSSLKYLKEFPIRVLKIDKSFVNDIGRDKNNEAIVVTTLRMAESLDMHCVAEGIEEPHQIEFFKPFACNKLQGYYFSKPVPQEDTYDLLLKRWDL